MQVKTIRYIVTSALTKLRKPPGGPEYTWLEQVAIMYLSEKAPLDGNVSLQCIYVDLGTSARVVSVPADCMRISRIAVKAGNRLWTLTVDNNLRIPENIFECTTPEDVSEGLAGFWPAGPTGWWNMPQYALGSGQNSNYYRIVRGNSGNVIILDHNVPDGELLIEYMSNGAELGPDSFIDVAYAEPFREYLMAEYCMFYGTPQEKAMYKELQLRYESAQWASNTLVNAQRMSEIVDAMAQSTALNLG